MASFVATPNIPTGRADLAGILSAAKQNIELLTATRGEPGLASRAFVRGDISVSRLGQQDLVSVTNVIPENYIFISLSQQHVAFSSPLTALRVDVEILASDVAETRAAFNSLIAGLKEGTTGGSFIATPDSPPAQVDLFSLLGAIKQNVELLTGTRGESDLDSRALVRRDIAAGRLGPQKLRGITNISPLSLIIVQLNQGFFIASSPALQALKTNVQALADDAAETRDAINELIKNLEEGITPGGRFIATPNIPPGRNDLTSLLSAIKQNIELLTGTSGESGLPSRALVRRDIAVEELGAQKFTGITNVSPFEYQLNSISSQDFASAVALAALRNDVQTLSNDVAVTRGTFDELIKNLGG